MRVRSVTLLALALAALVAAPAAQAELPSGRTTYRTLTDYDRDLARVVAEHPTVARAVVLTPTTVEGRTIRGVELATHVAARDDGRPTFLITGLTHAREWSSGEIAMEFALDLADRVGRDPTVRRLLARVRVVVVPVVNPDGFAVSRSAPPGSAAREHRTNCAAVTAAEAVLPCALRGGVDLNRNYGFAWGGPGADATPGSDQYRGPGPWSEPETQAVHALERSRQITAAVSLHNYGGLVLRQPGFRAFGRLPDAARQARLGDAMAAAAGYRSEPADALYDATGAQEDWSYANQDALAYTIEVAGTSFQGPYRTDVIDQYPGVRKALLLAGAAAGDPRGHAVLTGSASAVRILRVSRTFSTSTSPVCVVNLAAVASSCPSPLTPIAIPDGIDTTMRVPADGRFRWDVTPSTGARDESAGRTTAWTVSCEAPEGFVLSSRRVVVRRGQTRALGAVCAGSTRR